MSAALNNENNYILSGTDRHGQLFLNKMVAIAIADVKTMRFLDVNDAWCALYGYSLQEAQNMSACDVCIERETGDKMFRNVKIGESVHVALQYHHKKNGSIFAAEIFANCYEMNGCTKMCAMIKDVSDKIQTEENLNKSEKLYRSLIENSPVLIQILNIDGTIAYSSPTAKEILGYDEEELVNQSFIKFLLPEDALIFLKFFNDLIIDENAKNNCIVSFKHKDGQYRFIDARMANMINEAAVKGIIINAIDITNRKKVENEIKNALQIAEDAKAAANAANLAKSQFLANISHEIRTPLNSIIGFSEMMKKTPLNDAQIELTDYITFSGKWLFTLIDEILDYSKIEAGQIDIEINEFDLAGTIDEVISMLKTKAAEKKVYLSHINSYSAGCMLKGDKKRLSQVLLNLLSNAVKFTANGKVIAKTEVMNETGGLINIMFSIIDEGIGISDEKIKVIFNPFIQSDGSTTRKYGGTGLGLTIADRLVKLMGGGDIIVESRENIGSKFYFSLPFEKGAELKANNNKDSFASKNIVKKEYDILLVEDNYMNIILMKKLMKQFGHRVHTAENGFEALKTLENKNFDLILLDLQMPVMDGFETAKRIRKLSIKTPIIAVTASAAPEDYDTCRAIGINGFIIKPLNITEFENIVEKIIKSTAAPGEIAISDRLKIKKNGETSSKKEKAVIFNKSTLYENMSHIDELVKDSIELFLKYSPRNIENIAGAIKANDAEKIKFYSHSMKSTARGIGAEIIAEILFNLEKNSSSGKIDDQTIELSDKLAREYGNFIQRLKDEGLV